MLALFLNIQISVKFNKTESKSIYNRKKPDLNRLLSQKQEQGGPQDSCLGRKRWVLFILCRGRPKALKMSTVVSSRGEVRGTWNSSRATQQRAEPQAYQWELVCSVTHLALSVLELVTVVLHPICPLFILSLRMSSELK